MSIEETLNKYGITNYTINDDGVVDVDGGVDLNGYGLTELPLKFGKVTGNFTCKENQLTSLYGSPHTVGRNFNADSNKLTNLKGCPKIIVRHFRFLSNKIDSLKDGPEMVGEDYECDDNLIYNLDGFDTKFGGEFYCDNNPLDSIFNVGDQQFTDAFKIYKIVKDKEDMRIFLLLIQG